jgi:energy-coupling factor transport system permease protein
VLNAVTWWLLALAFLLSASITNNFVIQLGIVGVSLITAGLSRGLNAIKLYLWLMLFVFATRLLFAFLFNFDAESTDIAYEFPAFLVNLGPLGKFTLLGNLSNGALESALRQGVKLVAIISSIALANSMANPRKLLKLTPAAFYDFAAALSVAFNLIPQLAQSIERVGKAQRIRIQKRRKFGAIVVPVLEDALNSSMNLAASMDSRGFGRKPQMSKNIALLSRTLNVGALLAIAAASYLLLGTTGQTFAAWLLIDASVLALTMNIFIASRLSIRTQMTKLQFKLADFVVLILALGLVLIASV